MSNKQYFAGIDIGASSVKVIIINEKEEIVANAFCKSGVDLIGSARTALNKAKNSIKLPVSDITEIVSTGFGRNSLPFARSAITEISAHSKGVYYYFPRALTIIDIGAQDNKIIKIDNKGHIVTFKMNRKCAAGTGAFIEEIAYKMDIPLRKLNALAKKSSHPVELGSYCTVFTATEILSKIREGKSKEDIIRGVFGSAVKRIIEMDPLDGEIVLTGGVIAHNDIITVILKNNYQKEILVPPLAQFTGAIGAALTGRRIKQI